MREATRILTKEHRYYMHPLCSLWLPSSPTRVASGPIEVIERKTSRFVRLLKLSGNHVEFDKIINIKTNHLLLLRRLCL